MSGGIKIQLPASILAWIDAQIKTGWYKSRPDLILAAVRHLWLSTPQAGSSQTYPESGSFSALGQTGPAPNGGRNGGQNGTAESLSPPHTPPLSQENLQNNHREDLSGESLAKTLIPHVDKQSDLGDTSNMSKTTLDVLNCITKHWTKIDPESAKQTAWKIGQHLFDNAVKVGLDPLEIIKEKAAEDGCSPNGTGIPPHQIGPQLYRAISNITRAKASKPAVNISPSRYSGGQPTGASKPPVVALSSICKTSGQVDLIQVAYLYNKSISDGDRIDIEVRRWIQAAVKNGYMGEMRGGKIECLYSGGNIDAGRVMAEKHEPANKEQVSQLLATMFNGGRK